MKFFEPNHKFLPAIKPLIRHQTVVDCGCGDGHIYDILLENGIKAIAVDYMNSSERSDIIKGDAINYVTSQTLPLVCRPCAGDWYFKIFQKAQHGILVAKPEHYKRDILGLRKRGFTVTLVQKGVGDANESLYYIGDDMKAEDKAEVYNFALVQCPMWDGPWWVEDKGDNYWHNYSGGRCPKSVNDKILERCATSGDFEALDWTKTDLVSDKHESGWLSPNGDFYGCEYMAHDRVAALYLKQKLDTLYNFGWMRIYSKDNWHCRKEPTDQQVFFLKEKGYELDLLRAASPYNGGNDE